MLRRDQKNLTPSPSPAWNICALFCLMRLPRASLSSGMGRSWKSTGQWQESAFEWYDELRSEKQMTCL